jgi:hypothetical protein
MEPVKKNRNLHSSFTQFSQFKKISHVCTVRYELTEGTYTDVMLPLLRAAVPALEKADGPDAFAFESRITSARRCLASRPRP